MGTSENDKKPTTNDEHELKANEQEPTKNNTNTKHPKKGWNPLFGSILMKFMLMVFIDGWSACIARNNWLVDLMMEHHIWKFIKRYA